MSSYKTKEQRAVVESRIRQGYAAERQPNGDWLLYKGRHTMRINGLGYDTYLRKGEL